MGDGLPEITFSTQRHEQEVESRLQDIEQRLHVLETSSKHSEERGKKIYFRKRGWKVRSTVEHRQDEIEMLVEPRAKRTTGKCKLVDKGEKKHKKSLR